MEDLSSLVWEGYHCEALNGLHMRDIPADYDRYMPGFDGWLAVRATAR